MKYSMCKSSMEAHIEHCIASFFSFVLSDVLSKKDIETYLKLHEMFLNDINILNFYLNSYHSLDTYVYSNEKEVGFSFFEKKSTSNIPSLSSSNPISFTIHGFSYLDF